MKSGMWQYIKSAFNARPIGMLVPPNWVGLAGIGLLGVLNPGIWLLGAGLELAYLFGLSTNQRFQRFVDAQASLDERRQWEKKLGKMVEHLLPEDRERYRTLEQRCQRILQQQSTTDAARDLTAQGEGLGRLLWIYLRLLTTRQSIVRVMRESIDIDRQREPLHKRLRRLENQIADESLSEELRKSLSSQLDILVQRLEKRQEAEEKLRFIEAELTRIQEQVELIREQAVLISEPTAVSQRIDDIAATLGGTNQWIKQQQQIYGQVDDLLNEPPPVTLQPAKETE